MSDNDSSHHDKSEKSSRSVSRHHSRNRKRRYSSDSHSRGSDSRSYSRSRSRSRSYIRDHSRSSSREDYGLPKIFITKLSPRVSEKDINKEFKVYGDIKNINLKRGFAFVEYYHRTDAKNAIKKLNNKRLFGQEQKVVVEVAKGKRRDWDYRKGRYYDRHRYHDRYKSYDNYSRKHRRKTGPKDTDECFNCGRKGHWANDCHYQKRDK
jgi:RNA recognition motif-containing protein